ncbi:hypothetical protein AVEN_74163-1, partial [Araneus ventricosus]
SGEERGTDRRGAHSFAFAGSIQHRKGTANGNADAFPRRPCIETCEPFSNAEKKFGIETGIFAKALTITIEDSWTSNEIQKAQLENPSIRPILKKKLNSADRSSCQEIARESPATKRYWDLRNSLHVKDGVLYRKWKSYDGSLCRWQLNSPERQNSRSSTRDS